MADYFETYLDNDPDFGFLDESSLRDLLAFWATWKRIYPLVYDLNLLSYSRTPATGLPASVDVGLELLNEAFYRISLGPYILEGGYWPKGFHILTIPLQRTFSRARTPTSSFSTSRPATSSVRKPVRVRVDIADMVAVPRPGAAGRFRRRAERRPRGPSRRARSRSTSTASWCCGAARSPRGPPRSPSPSAGR